MDTISCISAAHGSLTNAHRYLETGKAINWVSDKIISSIHWAMEGWLIGNDHPISHGRGWLDTHQAFQKQAPAELSDSLLKLYAQAAHLEFALMGDSDTSPSVSIAEWKIKVHECLENTEAVIHSLLADIAPERDK
jgi:hypothetical protein